MEKDKGKKVKNQKHCKIILLGEPAVGKTSIISKYVKGQFSDTQESTVGAAFSSKDIDLDNNLTYQLNIWDTAGAEIFRSINKLFYRDAAIAILVYDITRRASFEALLSYWIDEVKKETEKRICKNI